VTVRRSKFYKLNGPTARLERTGVTCFVDECRRARFRKGLCTAHYKRLQRKREVDGPIEESVMVELREWQHQVGDTLTPVEYVLKEGDLLVQTSAEDDELYKYRRKNFLKAAARWLESLGWVPPHNSAKKLARA
jgi:hypothetical protein